MHRYGLEPGRSDVGIAHASYTLENILFAVDVDREADVEMKAMASGGGSKGQVLRRLDAIKQALLLFIHSKLTINPLHQFALMTLGRSLSWHQREFTSNLDMIGTSIRALTVDGVGMQHFDLSALLQSAAAEAKRSISQGRSLRLILIYCRSSVLPELSANWVERQNSFTLDALYLHDKPAANNCPQKVYDKLVDVLEHVSEHEGYIFESSSGSARTLFRHMCHLLSHPHQRLPQDEVTNIRDLAPPRQVPEAVGPVPQAESGSGRGG